MKVPVEINMYILLHFIPVENVLKIIMSVADSFLRSRTSTDHEATAMMKTQFMSFWDGLVTESSCQIMIVGATNRPQDVDAAILRRMPSMFCIGLPVSVSFYPVLV